MTSNKRSFGYVRVSTREQNEARQILALKSLNIPDLQIFMDKQSGKDFDRPGWRRLMQALDNRSVLFIKSLDRLGRNYEELNDTWRVITKEIGADIVVIDMPLLDTRKEKNLVGTLISDIVLVILSFVSENERENIRLRQAEGIAAAKQRGVRFGRPQSPLPDNFAEICSLWRQKRLSLLDASHICGMPKSTFYYKAMNWVGNAGCELRRIAN